MAIFTRLLKPRAPGAQRLAKGEPWGGPMALIKALGFAVLLGAAGILLAPGIAAFDELDPYLEEIENFEEEIQSLESDASILLTITLLVVIFGVLAGALQAWTHRYTRVATAILGIGIAALTAVNQTAFDIDHRQCRRLARQVRRLVTDIKRDVGRLSDLPPAGRETLVQSIDAKRDTVYKILDSRRGGPAVTSLSLLGVVHAQVQSPDWTRSQPTDDTNWYFVGYAESTDAKVARFQAEERARNGASQAFQKPLLVVDGAVKDEVGRMTWNLAEIAEVVDDWLEYDKGEARYGTYVLLKLNRRYAESSAGLFGAREKIQNSKALVAALRQVDSKAFVSSAPPGTGPTHGVVRTMNSSRRIEADTWGWTLFIEADDETLAAVSRVEYRLHPTFPEPIHEVEERGHASGRGFELPGRGWGTFVDVRVFFEKGEVLYLKHRLTFDE